MLRVLTTKFQKSRRCINCQIVLSSSVWDTKPIALQFKKTEIQPRLQYVCISCAIRGKMGMGYSNYKITIEEIIKFLQAKHD